MTTYQFTLIVEGPDLQTDGRIDDLYEVGRDARRIDLREIVGLGRPLAYPPLPVGCTNRRGQC